MLEKLLMKKWLLIGIGTVIILALSGFIYYRTVYIPGQATEEPELQTALVRRGDLTIYASGTGTLVSVQEIDLGFGSNGFVAEINVQAGQEVKEGDVLAVQGDIDQLEAAVAADELAVLNAQQSLDDLSENAAVAAAQAMLDLANAQDELNTAQYTWSVAQEGNRASDATLLSAQAALEMAKSALERAKNKYDNDPDDPRLASEYANAQKSYDSALRNWNWYTGAPTELQQLQLDAEVALAEAKVTQAQQAYDDVKDGPNPSDLAMAELQLSNAEANLAVSRRNLEQSVITASMDGTVLTVDAKSGDTVSGPFITLGDLSQPYLEIYLDETDLDKIELGNEVEVVFDALPELTFTGKVVQIDPSLTSSGGVSAIKGLVQIDALPPTFQGTLLIGMNAAVDVIAGRAEDAILVPVEALRELSPGEYAVFVMEDDEPQIRFVEVGLMDFTYAEIVSGLSEGERVSTGIVEVE